MSKSYLLESVKTKTTWNVDSLSLSMRDPLFRNSAFLVLGRLLNVGVGFFFWLIAARLYHTEEVGVATALISSVTLIMFIASFGFNFSLIRFIKISGKESVLNTSICITTTAAVVVGIAYLLILKVFFENSALIQNASYGLFFLLTVVMHSIYFITGESFKALRDTKDYFMQNTVLSTRVLLLFPLVFLGSFGIFGAIGAAYLLATIYSIFILSRRIKLNYRIDRDYLKKSFSFSSGNYISNLLYESPSLLMPPIILSMIGKQEAALYYIAMAVSSLIWIAPMSLSASLFIEGSYGENLKKNVLKSGKAILIVLIPSIFFIYYFGGFVLEIFGQDYVEALPLLHVLVLSSFFVAVHDLFIPILNIKMRISSLIKLNFVRFCLLLGFSYIFLRDYGLIGFGYAWTFTHILLTVITLWLSRKEGWI
ncbi:oligosaccharide flippase family protein [Methanolobus sp.]|uniref:lipopolysaccharide biosynthesis protein n=1 Tax=Methanolobus sp. TaxID=1874737 RepID=UPI0025DDB0F5|nr:oligosaccharide flippase family protein [Methanolobus sp.]